MLCGGVRSSAMATGAQRVGCMMLPWRCITCSLWERAAQPMTWTTCGCCVGGATGRRMLGRPRAQKPNGGRPWSGNFPDWKRFQFSGTQTKNP